jgi:hypothetical protein
LYSREVNEKEARLRHPISLDYGDSHARLDKDHICPTVATESVSEELFSKLAGLRGSNITSCPFVGVEVGASISSERHGTGKRGRARSSDETSEMRGRCRKKNIVRRGSTRACARCRSASARDRDQRSFVRYTDICSRGVRNNCKTRRELLAFQDCDGVRRPRRKITRNNIPDRIARARKLRRKFRE